MEVTWLTWVVAVAGLALMGLLGSLQLVAVVMPRGAWTIENVYGGSPGATDPAVVVWGVWPSFGLLQGAYCFARLAG